MDSAPAVDVDRVAPDGQRVAAGAGERGEAGIELDRAVPPDPVAEVREDAVARLEAVAAGRNHGELVDGRMG